ncbi:chromate transporter [Paraliomyxa miuraensis]|uniref:chromate transporter n=1 Tax=Paraliomyxa miuraensis TaxID=376150 RepID=UPI002259DAAD|nr:chromate transporter [Paraliomyxa miuraensis]MCX4246252.1 chromate transporter [Paraliomyxa miuraensis]
MREANPPTPEPQPSPRGPTGPALDASPSPSSPEPIPARSSELPRVSSWQLMRTFALVSLGAFGGVMPWVYREVVDEKKWLDDPAFAELWGQSLIIPGATSANVVAALGYRLNGLRGAVAALAGLLGPTFVIVIALAVLYQSYGSIPAVNGAVRGVTAVAAGLVIATGIKLALGQPRKLALPLFAAAAFMGVIVLQLPLVVVILALLPLSFLVEWRASS